MEASAAPRHVRASAIRLDVAAGVVLVFVLLQAAWRSSELGEPAVTELPGLTAWLLLTILAVHAARPPDTQHLPAATSDRAVTVVAPVAAAVLHALAWSTDVAGLRLIASLVVVAALLGATVAGVPDRRRAGPVDVAQLGSLIAIVLLFGLLALEVVEALDALTGSSGGPAVLDARGPGLGALAVLTGMTLAEDGLRAAPRPVSGDRAGTFQMLLFGVGWLALVAGVASDDLGVQATAVALHVLAVAVFLVRLAPELPAALGGHAAARWFALAVLAAAAYVGLLTQIVAGFADERYADATSFPRWLETAVDVAAFVGLAAAATVGLVASHGRDGRRAGSPTRPVDTVAFAGFALAAIGVVAASITESPAAGRLAWIVLAASTVAVLHGVGSSGARDRSVPAQPTSAG